MNKDWMKHLKDLSQSSSRKAPEGLLDDIKKEMSRRGVMPVAQAKKARVIGITPQRIIAVAAVVLFIVGTTIYLKKDTWNVQQQISKINSQDSKTKAEKRTETYEHHDVSEKINTVQHLTLNGKYLARCAQNSQDSKTEIKEEQVNNVKEETTKEEQQDSKEETNANKYQMPNVASLVNTDRQASSAIQRSTINAQRNTSFGVYYGNMIVGNAGFGSEGEYSNYYALDCEPVWRDNNPDLISSVSPTITNVNHHHPIRFGLSVRYAINKRWSILSGITYSYLQSDFSSYNNISSTNSKQKLHYIGIPVSLSYNLWQTKHFNLYLIAGGEAEKLVKGQKESTKKEANKTNTSTESLHDNNLIFSTNAAAGIEYQAGKHISLFAEPGISYYFKNGSSIESHYTDKPLNFNLNIGIRIR